MKRKQSKALSVHKCCGRKIRVRVTDGGFVQVPHQCSDAADVAGIDWKALHDQFGQFYKAQIAAMKDTD